MMRWTLVVFCLFGLMGGCRTGKVAVDSAPNKPVFSLNMGKGVDALQRKDFNRAVQYFKLSIEEKPDSPQAYNLRGLALFMNGEVSLAKKDFEKVLELDADYVQSYQNLGSCLMKEAKMVQAEDVLRRARDRFPKEAAICFALGNLLVFQDRAEEGFGLLREGMRLDPEYLNREKSFETDIVLGENQKPEYFFNYASLFASTGNIEKTVEFLEKAKKVGFKAWHRLKSEASFIQLSKNPAILKFIE